MKKRRSIVHRMFSRRGWRWLQRATGVHRVHHPRWSFGWTAPFTSWVYFEEQVYKDDLDRDRLKIRLGHWERCPRESYHDSTTSGVY